MNSLTVTVLIGNSDDKLAQPVWSAFVVDLEVVVRELANHVHFVGYTNSASARQSMAITFEMLGQSDEVVRRRLSARLETLRRAYRQDSIAFTIGKTEFVSE